jgi:hypothetical protein
MHSLMLRLLKGDICDRSLGAIQFDGAWCRISMSAHTTIQLFEVSDVVVMDSRSDVGARNERHISALFSSHVSGLEVGTVTWSVSHNWYAWRVVRGHTVVCSMHYLVAGAVVQLV